MLIWTLKGDALEKLRAELEGAHTLRVAFDGGNFKYKVDEGVWAPGIEPDASETGTRAYVASLPQCDIHKLVLQTPGVPAMYDGRTRRGAWAYMCDACFIVHGVGLGTGRGQRLIVDPRNG